MKPHAQENLDAFNAFLTEEFTRLFTTPQYSIAAKRTTPAELARKFTLGLDNGTAEKDGPAVVAACKHFGIKHTYKAIREFLTTK